MAEGCIYIYTGDGRGKSPAAIGRAVQAAVEGKRVVIIQFLKGKGLGDSDFLRRMEPEIKLFRFEKSDGNFVELPEEKKQEEIQNIRNGIGCRLCRHHGTGQSGRSADPGRSAGTGGEGYYYGR